MSQDNAAFMLAYMGLFHGIDASRGLDEAERAQFRLRYELLKRTGAIPATPKISPAEWKTLRAYYLGFARYPFESGEQAEEIKTESIPFDDQGVTMLQMLADGRIAAGGGITGRLQFFRRDLTPDFAVQLDTPPVHLAETAGGYFVLTLGSLLGALDDENKAAIYFIDTRLHSARKVVGKLPRAGHFLMRDFNADGRADFLVAAFGAVTGGGVVLCESGPAGYRQKTISGHGSIVRLAMISASAKRAEFLALAGGAREALLHIVYEDGVAREKILAEYPPHLGSVWLEYADIDGDGSKEAMVLSGDNADAGPYNETKPDQGLRIYRLENDGSAKQVHFESLPGSLSMSLMPRDGGYDFAVSRFYAAPAQKQDITVLRRVRDFRFERRHLTLPSRPTVLTYIPGGLLVGAGNLPVAAKKKDQVSLRNFSGPPLMRLKLN